MLNWSDYRAVRRKYFGESIFQSRTNYQKYKKAKMNSANHAHQYTVKTAYGIASVPADLCCLAPCAPAQCTKPEPKEFRFGLKKQEEENLMNYASATVQAGTTETQDQRKYLVSRLSDVYASKKDPLYATFGLVDDEAPLSATELAARLKDGKFTIKTGEKYERPSYYHWTDMIVWRAPDRKADRDGYEAAKADLKKKYQEALDIIKIDEPKAGLEAIKALEAWTPTGAAN